MKKNVLPLMFLLAIFASCSSAYKTAQTPDDVYYSPGKTAVYAAVKKENKEDRYSRQQPQQDDYEDYTSSSDNNYLRMKIQNRYQWSALDDNDYWYSPNYAYNNYYGINSFNPYTLNSSGLSYYYSPFASIQPYSWFNNYYPSYGHGYGYSLYNSGFYGQDYGYGYYGYSPSNVVVVTSHNRTRTSRPLLGGYTNNAYNNYNNNRNSGGRYAPAGNGISRYNNTNSNSSVRYNNNNSNNSVRYNNNTSTNTNTNNSNSTPARSYTPSSSGSSSSSSGGSSVSRPVRH